MSRILIAGGPRVGKTWLADKLARETGAEVRHTDDLINSHSWSAASAEVAVWMLAPGPWIIEGVAVARAARKFLALWDVDAPADTIYLLETPREELTPGQVAMAKGCVTVWNEVHDELVRRGVRVTLC